MKTLRACLLVFILPAVGCLHASHLGFVVPSRCIRVTVESFTRPCNAIADGKFVCNGVVVSASCVAAPAKAAK